MMNWEGLEWAGAFAVWFLTIYAAHLYDEYIRRETESIIAGRMIHELV